MTDCWVLTEDMIGTQNQCVALAEALGYRPILKVIALKQPWKSVTPWIRHFAPCALTADSAPLQAPWPELVIASGRKAIAPALWIKKQSGNRTRIVVIQSPVIRDKRLDLVIAPQHDRYQEPNAIRTVGALSVITPEKLALAREEWKDRLSRYPAPRLAVLIGGSSKSHRLTAPIVEKLIGHLLELSKEYSVFVTASRRTEQSLRDRLQETLQGERLFYWDGTGANPYRGFLAWADALIVTEDSVSMISEAVSTGKPVHLLKMEGTSPRFARFHNYVIEKGYARWFTGTIGQWSYTPPDDLERSAAAVRSLLGRKR